MSDTTGKCGICCKTVETVWVDGWPMLISHSDDAGDDCLGSGDSPASPPAAEAPTDEQIAKMRAAVAREALELLADEGCSTESIAAARNALSEDGLMLSGRDDLPEVKTAEDAHILLDAQTDFLAHVAAFGSPPTIGPSRPPSEPGERARALEEAARAVVAASEGVRLPFRGDLWARLLDLRNALASAPASSPGSGEEEGLRARVEAVAKEWERMADSMRIRRWPEAQAADEAERETFERCAEALRTALAARADAGKEGP